MWKCPQSNGASAANEAALSSQPCRASSFGCDSTPQACAASRCPGKVNSMSRGGIGPALRVAPDQVREQAHVRARRIQRRNVIQALTAGGKEFLAPANGDFFQGF